MALYERLNAIGAFKAYDSVPDNAVFPYVVIDSWQALDIQLLIQQRERVRVYLSVWSRVKGQEEILKIMRAIKTDMQNVRLPVDRGRVVSCVVTHMRTQKDIANEFHTGLMTLEMRLNT